MQSVVDVNTGQSGRLLIPYEGNVIRTCLLRKEYGRHLRILRFAEELRPSYAHKDGRQTRGIHIQD